MPRYQVQTHTRGISLLHFTFYIYDFTFLMIAAKRIPEHLPALIRFLP